MFATWSVKTTRTFPSAAPSMARWSKIATKQKKGGGAIGDKTQMDKTRRLVSYGARVELERDKEGRKWRLRDLKRRAAERKGYDQG